MGSKTETKTEQVETNDPWAPAQPYILDTLREAKRQFNSDAGKTYFPGVTSVPMSWDTSYALDGIRNRAVYGNPLNQAAQNQALNTINGDYFNPTNDFYNAGTQGAFNNSADQQYQPFTQANQSQANNYYNDVASGHNPYLEQTFQNAAAGIADTVNSNFAKAGRYGSAAHQGQLTSDLAGFANDLYGGQYNQDQNRRLQAANAVQSAYDTDMARRMQAIGSMADLENQNYARQFQAAQGLDQNFQTERARQMQAMMGAGAMAANDYTDYDRLMQVGLRNEEQAQRDLQADIDRFNFLEQNDFNRLAQYANMAFGYGGLGGTRNFNGTEVRSVSGMGPAIQGFNNFAQGFNSLANAGSEWKNVF